MSTTKRSNQKMKVPKQADSKLNLYRNKTTSNNAMVKYGLLVLLKNQKKALGVGRGSFIFKRKNHHYEISASLILNS